MPVGQPRGRPFQEPARARQPGPEVHAELGGVHVMDHAQHRHPPGQDGWGEERDPGLAVHHRVERAAVREEPGEDQRVHGEAPAQPGDRDSLPPVPAGLAGRPGRQEADPGAPGGQAAAHLPGVPLRATCLRMPRVAPVEDGDPKAAEIWGQDGHAVVTAAGGAGGETAGVWGGRAGRWCSQMAARSRATPAEWCDTENVEPGTSRQVTGISVRVAPSRWQRAISSMSNAKPVVRSGRTAALASGPEKNLKPHWVSLMPGTIRRARERNAAAPIRRIALRRSSTIEPSAARDPMTTCLPDASRLRARSRADRSVAMSASQKPTSGARVASRPVRTASPLPGRSHRSSRTGTGPAGQSRTSSPVPSVLALSTTTTPVRTGSEAALRHSAASPAGSRRASLCAGTMISMDTGESQRWPSGGTARTAGRSAIPVLVDRGVAGRPVADAGQRVAGDHGATHGEHDPYDNGNEDGDHGSPSYGGGQT